MGAGRQPSRINIDQDKFAAAARERANSMNPSQPGQDDRSDYFGPDKFAEAIRKREAAAAARERANSMNPSQPGQDDRSDYFGQDKFDTLLRNLEREKERLNRRKVRGMLM